MNRIFCVQLSFLSLSHHHVPVIPTILRLCLDDLLLATEEMFYNYREQVFDIFQVIYDMTPNDESYS
jgi:hypothetical protein